jgi:hypothetical protein
MRETSRIVDPLPGEARRAETRRKAASWKSDREAVLSGSDTRAQAARSREQATDEQHAALSRAGLAASHGRIERALSISCPVCAARPGEYCRPSCGGLCAERWTKALGIAPRHQPVTPLSTPVPPSELEELAAAARTVEFHHAQDEAIARHREYRQWREAQR